MSTTQPPHVCVPVNLDAFVLNEKVCNATTNQPGASSCIAPITQPDYVSLRLSNAQLQHDILPPVDLHNARSGGKNPRIASATATSFKDAKSDPEPDDADLIKVDPKRTGVIVHWSLPRAYRSASSQAAPPPPSASDDQTRPNKPTNPQPVFPLVPNRWLVVRSLRDCQPPDALKDPVSAWVIESDRLRRVEELDLDENGQPIDLETDVAPFVAYAGGASDNPDILNNQAQIYIGCKTPLAKWHEKKLRNDQKAKGSPPAGADGTNFIDLTVMNSSNPLFADYTAHNANVFSIKDNFYYGNGRYLQSATADYVVIGWHSDQSTDPLWMDTSTDLASRLQRCFCVSPTVLVDSKPQRDTRTDARDRTRLLCHAAKYGVRYSADKPPSTRSDACAANFTRGIDMEPVSVGQTPLDAVLAFFQAHVGDGDDDLTKIFDQSSLGTAKTLMGIRELLYATEDDYDSRVKAADLIFSHSFNQAAGGFRWEYNKQKESNGPPIAPSDGKPPPTFAPAVASPPVPDSEVDIIARLNDAQRKLDAASAKLDLLRWSLFAEWFKFLSDPHSDTDHRKDMYDARVKLLHKESQSLKEFVTSTETTISSLQKRVQVRKVPYNSFFKRRDPTLCIAGTDAGWDPEFLNDVPTRFADHVGTGGVDGKFNKTIDLLSDTKLFSSDNASSPETEALSATIVKLFKESVRGFQQDLSQYGSKNWDGQPFSPQFVEWQGVYYHVPWDEKHWDVQLAPSALASSNHNHVTYVNPSLLSTMDDVKRDHRAVSGRILVLPQPSFALSAVLAQVLSSTPKNMFPPDMPDLQDPQKQKNLVAAASSLKFISGEMTGLTDALLTLVSGQHVQPNVLEQGGTPRPMKPSVDAGLPISLQQPDFETMANETGRTPYGTLYRFHDQDPYPFKGVQHGQLAITKLVIVDKFGQSIACPEPKRIPQPGAPVVPEFIHPCLGEQLMPSMLNGSLNTVYSTQDTHDAATKSGVPMTPFIQLSPTINQEARLNAAFLELSGDAQGKLSWRPCSDWENPIFGWMIVNYPDSSLQFFTADGTYYTSRQFGGPTGTIESLKWLPFDPPPADQAKAIVSPQLIKLIAKMGEIKDGAGSKYLQTIWDVVRNAIPTMPFPPSEYAAYANAIVGKPLALVNVGCSIELAQPPYWAQHTLPKPPAPDSNATIDPLRTQANKAMGEYQFKVKIGDAERPFDGVVAYWDTPQGSTDSDFSHIYAYSSSDAGKGFSSVIEPSNFPKLSPYFLDPDAAAASGDGATYTQQHTSRMMVKTMLIDPYTPIHFYTGVLPIRSLQLASWTIQAALKKMTAFFTMGPLLISKDVPKEYDANHPLKPDTWLSAQTQALASTVEDPIKLPIAGGKGLWNWLQPYMVADAAGAEAQTRYNALSVGADDGRLRNDPAPYTLVEGYLQLARPLTEQVVPKP